MSFFDDASLVMIPSGYKTSKVYSVKPTDGTGDLAFTRSNSTATRVASNGLIEKVRTNLITYSQDFGNAAWAVDQLTKTTGQVDPNGGTTAVLLTSTNTFSTYMYQVKAGLGCLSIYAKAGTRSTFALIPTGYNNGAFFDLSSVTATASGIGSLAKIESVGGGWFRCSVATSSSTDFIVSLSNIAGTGSVIGDTMTFAFAQGETGDIATPYIATTTAAVSVGPVANVPRLDYLNSSCPRLLLEPQRTNLVTYSEQFNNAAYALNNATITANSVVSPDGYTNADTYTATGGGNYINGVATSAGSNTITYSVFAKAGTQNVFRIREANYFGSATIFNLSTGTVTSGTGTITSYGNGWYRCTHTQAYGAGQTFVSVIFDTTASSGTFYLYGAQFEVGAYATSYIPTLGAAVTRGADAASKTGISSLIGQTEGTLFLEVKAQLDTTDEQDFSISDGTTSNRALIRLSSGGLIQGVGVFGGSLQFALGSGAYVTGQSYKIALAYKLNDVALYVNGVQAGTDTSATISGTLSRLGFDVFTTGAQIIVSPVKQALLFKTRLTNAQLAELTTI